MSCSHSHDWPQILAHRFVPEGREPEDLSAALAHAGECADCRHEALQTDPSLLFGLMARREQHTQNPGPSGDADIERMRRAVDDLRRLRRIAEVSPRRRAPWRFAAAAGFLLAVLSLGPSTMAPMAPMAPMARGGSPAGLAAARVTAAPAVAGPALAPQWSIAPVVEPLGGEARVYELDSASDLAVVLIVDQTIDV